MDASSLESNSGYYLFAISSSVVSWILKIGCSTGFAGHANYCAANAAVDAIADSQSAMGRPSVAVQWGAWSSVGRALLTIPETDLEMILEVFEIPVSTAVGRLGETWKLALVFAQQRNAVTICQAARMDFLQAWWPIHTQLSPVKQLH